MCVMPMVDCLDFSFQKSEEITFSKHTLCAVKKSLLIGIEIRCENKSMRC